MIMKTHDITYNSICEEILKKGTIKKNRTGQDTIGIFGHMAKFDLFEGFPLLTTKKMAWKSIVTELLWFISGDTNIKYLVDNGCNIWTKDAYRHYNVIMQGSENKVKTEEEFVLGIKKGEIIADLGKGTYGSMWRSFPAHVGMGEHLIYESCPVDQLKNVIEKLKNSPDDRRMLVSAWHPYWVDHCALPPCHVVFQFNTVESSFYDKRILNLCLFQRSCDTFLGVPFNIASYALLLQLVAHCVDMIPGTFTHFYGDLHIYTNHIDQVREQIKREPYNSPSLELILDAPKNLFSIKQEHIHLVGYTCHPSIKGEVSTQDLTKK